MTAPSVAPLTEAVTVTIPGGPVYELSPNARVHHMAKHRATQDAQRTARAILRNDVPIANTFFGPVTLDWVIRLAKGRKRMDWDNAIVTLKPYMDSLVLSGVIRDDNTDIVTRIGLKQQLWSEHRVNGGEIVVIVTPVADAPGGLG